MKYWNRYFFGDVEPTRVLLLSRTLLLLFAFDVWANMLSRAGRYGVEGFNVAHFDWLDRMTTAPSPGFYIATMTIAAAAAFMASLLGLRLWLVLIAAAGMNYGWAMSLLDSYQHHYLLGLLLLCTIGFAERRRPVQEDGPSAQEEPQGRAHWGFPLVCCVLAIVYLFAAISKLDAPWRNGEVLQRIAGARAQPLMEIWATVGGTDANFWVVAGHLVIAAELLLCVAYFVAPLADRGNKAARAVCVLGLAAALPFHAGVEWIGLAIEWFSYYLFLLAVACFAPARVFAPAVRGIARMGTTVSGRFGNWIAPEMRFALFGVIAALTVVVVAVTIDLPGVSSVGATAAFSMVVLMWAAGKSTASRRRAGKLLAVAAACALAMLAVVEYSDTRYDYYRFVGGDALRRSQRHADLDERRALLEDSLFAYQKANRYAPPDDDRIDKENRVRTLLGKPARAEDR